MKAATPSHPSHCPTCGGSGLYPDYCGNRLAVVRCRQCGHRLAHHLGAPDADVESATDYHAQYDQSTFLSALGTTRRRQSHDIVALIKRCLPDARSLVDFGVGRGWLFDTARCAGIGELMGVDTSKIAIDLLRSRGYQGELLPSASPSTTELPPVPWEPDVLTILDVIEHFHPDSLRADLEALLRHYRPRLIVIKVPISSGVLYRCSSLLAAAGVAGPLDQLYQVGSYPPHFSYFSRESLVSLLERCGLEILTQQGDLEFEPRELAGRVRVLQRFPLFSRMLGQLLAGTAKATQAHDAQIVVARASVEARSRLRARRVCSC